MGRAPLGLLIAVALSGCSLHGLHHEEIDPGTGAVIARTSSFDANAFRRTRTVHVSGKGARASVPLLDTLQEPDEGDETVASQFAGLDELLGDLIQARARELAGQPASREYDLAAERGLVYMTEDLEGSEDAIKLGRTVVLAYVYAKAIGAISDGLDVLTHWIDGEAAADAAAAGAAAP